MVASFNSYPPKVYEIFNKSNSITVGPHKISVRMNNKVHCKTCGLIGHGTNACWTKDKSEAAKWVKSFNSSRFVFSVSRQPANVNVTESNEDKEEVIPASVSPSHTKLSASVAAASVLTGSNISESSDSLSVPSPSESTVTPSKSSSISLASKQATVPAPAVNKHSSNVKSASTSRRNSSTTNPSTASSSKKGRHNRASTVGGAKSLRPNATPEGAKSLFNSPPSSTGTKRKKDDLTPFTAATANPSAKKQRNTD